MDEEKKVYGFVGTVTISSEEYRDLIERAINSENEATRQREKWYEEYKLTEKLKKKLKNFEDFLKSEEEAYAMYMVWKTESGDL